jgi:hypothetical protein
LSELSIFVDESRDKSAHAQYFILTLVVHDQNEDIASDISIYEQSLTAADLPNIPFHSEPLLNGHGAYEELTISSLAALARSRRIG